MSPRTKAGTVLLHEHSSGTPHMAGHIRAIEDEMLDKVAAAVEWRPAHFHCGSCMADVLAAIEEIRKADR